MCSANANLTVQRIGLDLITRARRQARCHFDTAALLELAASIAESGVIQPIVVRSTGGGYELLAGERRWRASQMAGCVDIPAIVRNDLSEQQAHLLGLVENLQRESLCASETAEGLRLLGEEYGLTHEQIAQRVGKSRAYISNYLRLLGLEPRVLGKLDRGDISLGHAKVLAGASIMQQCELANDVVKFSWSVRTLERRMANTDRARESAKDKGADVKNLERELSDLLGNKVEIGYQKNDKAGTLRIQFNGYEELDGLLRRLGRSLD